MKFTKEDLEEYLAKYDLSTYLDGLKDASNLTPAQLRKLIDYLDKNGGN